MEGLLVSTILFCGKFQTFTPVAQVVNILFSRRVCKIDRSCVSFPFNQTSEVVLYSITDGPNGNKTTKLEVMPIGTTREETLFDIFIEFLPLLIAVLLLIAIFLLLFYSFKK